MDCRLLRVGDEEAEEALFDEGAGKKEGSDEENARAHLPSSPSSVFSSSSPSYTTLVNRKVRSAHNASCLSAGKKLCWSACAGVSAERNLR